MVRSPLPSRSRPSASGDSSHDSIAARRNPFTIAKAASLSRANSSSSGSKSSSHTPSQSSTATTQSKLKPKPKPIEDDIEDSDDADDDDDDDDDDDGYVGGGLASSPYFTQPTQPVTQPTQLLKKPPTTLRRQDSNSNGNYNGDSLLPSSSSAPPLDTIPVSIPSSSPLRPVPSFIEVPASSPLGRPTLASPTRNRAAPPAAKTKMPQGRLAGRMAPAGTIYKAPARAPDSGNESDDSPLNNIISIQDSSEDEQDSALASRRARGDIRPSSFHRGGGLDLHKEREREREQLPSYRSDSNQTSDNSSKSSRKMPREGLVVALIRKMRIRLNSLGHKIDDSVMRECLAASDFDYDQALKTILDGVQRGAYTPDGKRTPTKATKDSQASKKDLIRGFAYTNGGSGAGTVTANTSRASTPATPSSQHSMKRGSAMESSPRPKRRRLVQGRQNREASPPPPSVKPKTEASKAKPAKGQRNRIIIASDDEEESDEEDVDDSNSPEAIAIDDDDDDDDVIEIDDDEEEDADVVLDVERRVLEYLNTCTVDDLVAMLGAKARTRAKTILSHRPFHSRASVTRIRTEVVNGARGRKKPVPIGEDIYEGVEDYVAGLRAIDVVVAQCEKKGLDIRTVLNRWNVDVRGSKKGLLTPESGASPSGSSPLGKAEASKSYVPLPIPQEPELMRGHCEMKTYQLFGLNWLWELYQRRFGCILADDMGLGKTCQVISFLSHLIGSYDGDEDDEDTRPWPNLVIVPPSTLANWEAEFARFAPGISVATYRGSMSERMELMEDIQMDRASCHVVLTTYSMVTNKQDLYAMRKLMPNTAIFDEGHKMKNCNTAVYQSLRRVEANWRLVLTGTPVQNNLTEMISLLRFIQPHLFEQHVEQLDKLFSQKFSLQEVSNGALLLSDRVRRARSILEPFILQRRKEQVLTGMPKKTSRVEYCDMDDTQRDIYETYEQQFREEKVKREQAKISGNNNKKAGAAADDDDIAAFLAEEAREKEANKRGKAKVFGISSDQNNLWVQLRKAAIHAQLFRRYFTDKMCTAMGEQLMTTLTKEELKQPNKDHLVMELCGYSDFDLHTWCRDYPCLASWDVPEGYFLKSGKVQKLIELVRGYQKNGDRALVFSRFARVLNILREALAYMDIPYVLLEGATRVDERQAIINEYNGNPEITVFLLTTGAGGTGINLVAANKVVIFDQSDNPQDDVQAENRAHRLGQTREVEVVKLVTRGTIEELVYKACQTKLELAQRVTAGSASRDEVEAYERMEREAADGAKASKALEEEVLKMMQERGGGEDGKDGEDGVNDETLTPPGSDAESDAESDDSEAREVADLLRFNERADFD